MIIYKNQAVRINFTIGIDEDLTTSIVLNYRKPSGVEGEFSPITVETGDIYYDATNDEIDEEGVWVLWSYVTTSSGEFPGNPFTIEVKPEGVSIVNKDFVKAHLGITSTSYDVQIDNLIPLIEEEYLRIRNAPFKRDALNNIVYPSGSAVTCSDMIALKLRKPVEFEPSEGVISSESIGSYSVSYVDGSAENMITGGWPLSITGGIKRYIRGE